MNMKTIAAIIGVYALCLTTGMPAQAQEAKGPTQFHLAMLAENNVNFVLPSAIIVDERGKLSGITLTVTNHTKKDQGLAIDALRVKETVKPGETKTITLSATDLDAIGTDQSVFQYYNHLAKEHIGGLLYIKR